MIPHDSVLHCQYWVPHDAEVWLPGWLLREEPDGSTVYHTEVGDVTLPTSRQLDQIIDGDELEGVSDICQLASVTFASLLHAVRVRYGHDEIYTNVSRILIAVNPFKPLNIYSGEFVELYRSAKELTNLPPHVFSVTADAFVNLADEGRNQAVLISGESGAGKTESTKLALLYASEVLASGVHGFEDRILEVNPILEAFGNARTVRNNNSSRFGKWIEVLADPAAMSLSGATVTDYLLEVTRVCSQGAGERNYHIFYQLTSDGGGAGLEALRLRGGADRFAYLNRNPAVVPELDDADGFLQLRKAFASLRLSSEEQESVFRIAAGVLHLGNVQFGPSPEDGKQATVLGSEGGEVGGPLACAAEVLGCCTKRLSKCVLFKRLVVGREITETPLDPAMALRARDSIAKLVYGRLFRWLVARCNRALGVEDIPCAAAATLLDKRRLRFVGVLDIAGFESFETNMLEQLFINLSNEKLQQFFNDTVFKRELSDYEQEGIDVSGVSFEDNSDVLALVEGKGGLLPLLDDASTGVMQTDALYMAQVVKAHGQHPRFIKPRFPSQPVFGVNHFAGRVTYTTEGFLEKNVSLQPHEVLELMEASENAVLRELVTQEEAGAAVAAAGGEQGAVGAPQGCVPKSSTGVGVGSMGGALRSGGQRKSTVSLSFRRSLQQLMEKLKDAKAHFVRCMKPNALKVADRFDSQMVADQLRLSGIMAAVKIRKAGFAIRTRCRDFVKRYLLIVPRGTRKAVLSDASGSPNGSVDFTLAARGLLEVLPHVIGTKFSSSDYVVGKTKVFMKSGVHRTLEQHRRLALAGPATEIQTYYRGFSARGTMREAKETHDQLRRCLDRVGLQNQQRLAMGCALEKLPRATMMDGSLLSLDALIQRSEGLLIKTPLLTHAVLVRARLAAESNLTRQMQDLANGLDLPAMEALLARSASYNMKGELVNNLRRRCDLLKAQQTHRRALRDCRDFPELEDIEPRIAAAREAGLSKPEAWLFPDGPDLFAEAERRLADLAAEREAQREEQRRVDEAAAAAAAAKAAEADAREARRKADQERKSAACQTARLRIAAAAEEYDSRALETAFSAAEEAGVAREQYAEEYALFMELQNGEFVQEKLDVLRARCDSDAEMLDLLVVSNLADQLEALGLKREAEPEEMREVTGAMLGKESGRKSVFDTNNGLGLRVAEKCFNNLLNFSKLRNPEHWGKSCRIAGMGGIDALWGPEDGVPAMLQFSAERITEPLTQLESSGEMAAIRTFGHVLRCMGDKPSAYIGDKEQPVLKTAMQSLDLCDEVYIQVMKQLTGNPSDESSAKGWQLLHSLCQEVVPSAELCEFLRAFLRKAVGRTAGGDGDELYSRRGRSSSTAAEAERQLTDWGANRSSFLQSKPDIAKELLDVLDSRCNPHKVGKDPSKSVPRRTEHVSSLRLQMYTEDGLGRIVMTQPQHTLGQLRERMLKVYCLHDGYAFDFFADSGDGAPLSWLMAREMEAKTAVDQTSAGDTLVFGRLNIGKTEDLPIDDIPTARLTFLHARQQFLRQDAPESNCSVADVNVAEVGGALLAADKAEYAVWKRKGYSQEPFKAKAEALKKDIEEGLLGEGVLERFVPAARLRLAEGGEDGVRGRRAWAQLLLEALARSEREVARGRRRWSAISGGAVPGRSRDRGEGGRCDDEDEDDGSMALVAQSRAVVLMQTWIPDFESYIWRPVAQVTDCAEVGNWWEVADLTARTSRTPTEFRPVGIFHLKQALPDAEFSLYLNSAGLELRPLCGNGECVPLFFRRGPWKQNLVGWRAFPGSWEDVAAGDWLALGVSTFGVVGGPGYASKHAMLRVPFGSSEAITALLNRYAPRAVMPAAKEA